ncbi:MAG: sodium ion-translocating decarboxylase subunit beta, partial [Spirochaetales bacterium]|nr:sodium ion-translocating decarboxylase subunit beta [Spirochaetales bacterium]
MLQSLLNLWQSTGLYGFFGLGGSGLGFGWGNFVMILVGFLLFYLAIKKGFEPLLLVPIGMGCVLSNIPFAYIASMDPALSAGAQGATGFIKILFDAGIQSGLFPVLILMGVGAMTDFG